MLLSSVTGSGHVEQPGTVGLGAGVGLGGVVGCGVAFGVSVGCGVVWSGRIWSPETTLESAGAWIELSRGALIVPCRSAPLPAEAAELQVALARRPIMAVKTA